MFRHAPELYRHTRGFVSGPEYVALRLTGCWHTALPAPAFQRYYWDDGLVAALAMDPAKLPPFVATGAPLGRTTAAAAAGAACNRSGSSDGVNYCSRSPVSDPRLLCLPHIVDGLYSVAGLISTTGKALEWFARIAHDDGTLYERAARGAPGAGGVLFLPYLAGERTPLWRGDVRAVFSGLGLEHGREEMARAVLEAVGYALRDSVTAIEEAGGPVDAIRLSGARAGNAWLNRIKADIVGRPLLVPEVLDAELTGCVCVASRALGIDASVADAATRLVKISARIEPRTRHTALYEDGFARYLEQQARL